MSATTIATAAPGGQPWMGGLPDTRSLADLSLPGTHDSAAWHGRWYVPDWAVVCQQLDLAGQLQAGIRVFDLRLKVNDARTALDFYHGAVGLEYTFDEALGELGGFLRLYPSEALVLLVKNEAGPGYDADFERLFRGYLAQPGLRWVLDPLPPTLGATRGRAALVRRFPVAQGPLGLDATYWPSDQTFASPATGPAVLCIQDQYKVHSARRAHADKLAVVQQLLEGKALEQYPGALYLNYLSATGLATGRLTCTPYYMAVGDDPAARPAAARDPGLNELVLDYLRTHPRQVLGTVLMDFATLPTPALIQAIIDSN